MDTLIPLGVPVVSFVPKLIVRSAHFGLGGRLTEVDISFVGHVEVLLDFHESCCHSLGILQLFQSFPVLLSPFLDVNLSLRLINQAPLTMPAMS